LEATQPNSFKQLILHQETACINCYVVLREMKLQKELKGHVYK